MPFFGVAGGRTIAALLMHRTFPLSIFPHITTSHPPIPLNELHPNQTTTISVLNPNTLLGADDWP